MSNTPKTDKIIELICELFDESGHHDYISSKDTFTNEEMEEICDLVNEASFVINSVDALTESLKAIETAKLGDLDK